MERIGNPLNSKDILQINDDWRMFRDKFIGRGCFGDVFKGQNKTTGEIVAVKMVRLEMIKMFQGVFDQERLMKEIQLMQDLSKNPHENIVKFYDYVEQDRVVYMMMELCDTTLLNHLKEKKKFTEEEALRYGAQILEGLHELHERSISHRDLKLDNILIKNGVCKITDFGMGADKG